MGTGVKTGEEGLADAERSVALATSPTSDEFRILLLAHRATIRDDEVLLRALGVRLDGGNVVEFGPAALSRVAAAHRRERVERTRLEAVAEANDEARARTHAAALDIIGSRDLADLARRIDETARRRLGLRAGVAALQGPRCVPQGWTVLVEGQVDMIMGPRRRARLGHAPTALGLFPAVVGAVQSVALLRLSLWKPRRFGVLAFGAAEPDAFAADMAPDLLNFLARIVERTAERWPKP